MAPPTAEADLVVRTVRPTGEARILVAGLAAEAPALYLAANGCDVVAMANEEDVVERVLAAAAAAGLGERIHAQRADWSAWSPNAVLDAVIVTSNALDGLSAAQRTRVIKLLQAATADGGIHLVEADMQLRVPSLRELESRYQGWSLSLEKDGSSEMLLARKEIT
jgi:cyclopropane fatty-acyl-phospholipid synthase-like methyltransferase